MRFSGVTPNFFRYGTAERTPSILGSAHTSWLPTLMKNRPSNPAARISSSGAGSLVKRGSLTRFQYGLSVTVKPWLPHHTELPLFTSTLARSDLRHVTL